jgi:hypothetical protein
MLDVHSVWRGTYRHGRRVFRNDIMAYCAFLGALAP